MSQINSNPSILELKDKIILGSFNNINETIKNNINGLSTINLLAFENAKISTVAVPNDNSQITTITKPISLLSFANKYFVNDVPT
jgi:hypothetical protein